MQSSHYMISRLEARKSTGKSTPGNPLTCEMGLFDSDISVRNSGFVAGSVIIHDGFAHCYHFGR